MSKAWLPEGLIAHYPLNMLPLTTVQEMVSITRSYTPASGTMTYNTEGVCIDYGVSVGASFYVPLEHSMYTGAYTVSFSVADLEGSVTLSFPDGSKITIVEGRNTLDINLKEMVSVGLLVSDDGLAHTGQLLITNFSIIPKQKVTDCSGLKNHAYLVGGVPMLSNDSARNTGSYQFASGITLQLPQLENAQTICYWSKVGNGEWTFNSSNTIPATLGNSAILLNDIRIYNTVLSQEVLDKFRTVRGSVDENGAVLAYSFKEEDKNSLDNHGILSNAEFEEGNSFSIYKTKTVANEFYEI